MRGILDQGRRIENDRSFEIQKGLRHMPQPFDLVERDLAAEKLVLSNEHPRDREGEHDKVRGSQRYSKSNCQSNDNA